MVETKGDEEGKAGDYLIYQLIHALACIIKYGVHGKLN